MLDINQLLFKMLEFRKKTLDFYSYYVPGIVIDRTKRPKRVNLFIQGIILRIWLLIEPFSFRRKLPKYVFSTSRYTDLILTLPPKEVMVMGGRKELIFCLKNGYQFYWLGLIFYGFNQFIFSEKNSLFSLVIVSLRKMFLKDINKRYLFLYNDCMPDGMTLSFALESIPKLNIICIQHGMSSPPLSEFKVDRYVVGESCQFNLLWDISQKKPYKSDTDHASFVLGLPYEVYPPQSHSREVILLGDCGKGSDLIQYFYALFNFCHLYRILKKAGIDVSYRPHPQDDIEYVQSIFSNVCITQKNELLTSNRRVFIGFKSSLLFEAREFGHLAIGLDSKDSERIRAFDVDFELSSDNFENLPELVLDIFEKSTFAEVDEIKNLKSRFIR